MFVGSGNGKFKNEFREENKYAICEAILEDYFPNNEIKVEQEKRRTKRT